MTVEQAFNASVDHYDDWMKKALPHHDDLFGSALTLIPFAPSAAIDVLDLGAGTGLFSQYVVGKYTQARFLLYDLADKMLNVAKTRFHHRGAQFSYTVGDYRALQVDRDFDVVISSLSIHHLTDAEKQRLFRLIFNVLRRTGVFINIDQIRGETEYLRDLYWNNWLTHVRDNQLSEQLIQESICRRTAYDRDALLSDQLQWLKNAGFVNVDCVYKEFFIGTFFAMKE